jgi:hypothetical protein
MTVIDLLPSAQSALHSQLVCILRVLSAATLLRDKRLETSYEISNN